MNWVESYVTGELISSSKCCSSFFTNIGLAFTKFMSKSEYCGPFSCELVIVVISKIEERSRLRGRDVRGSIERSKVRYSQGLSKLSISYLNFAHVITREGFSLITCGNAIPTVVALGLSCSPATSAPYFGLEFTLIKTQIGS
jgi:hypothetical protein